MSPLALLAAMFLFSKARGGAPAPYIPPSPGQIPPLNLPPGTPVTGMAAGGRYVVTVLFAHPNEPPPAQLQADLQSGLTQPGLTVAPGSVKVLQNTDGSWSGQATVAYSGGSVLLDDPLQRYKLLQLVTA